MARGGRRGFDRLVMALMQLSPTQPWRAAAGGGGGDLTSYTALLPPTSLSLPPLPGAGMARAWREGGREVHARDRGAGNGRQEGARKGGEKGCEGPQTRRRAQRPPTTGHRLLCLDLALYANVAHIRLAVADRQVSEASVAVEPPDLRIVYRVEHDDAAPDSLGHADGLVKRPC